MTMERHAACFVKLRPGLWDVWSYATGIYRGRVVKRPGRWPRGHWRGIPNKLKGHERWAPDRPIEGYFRTRNEAARALLRHAGEETDD